MTTTLNATASDHEGSTASRRARVDARLLVIGGGWPPETFLERLYHGLADRGIEVTIASSRRPDGSWLGRPNRRWLNAPSWSGSYPLRVASFVALLGRAAICSPAATSGLFVRDRISRSGLIEIFKRLPFAGRQWDLVYFPWNSAAIEAANWFNGLCPMVVSCRGSQVSTAPHNPERAQIRSGLEHSLRLAAAVHSVSRHTRSLAEQYGVDHARLRIIRPAVDEMFFRPSIRCGSVRPAQLVTTGNLIWTKGHEYLLSAIRLLIERGEHVHLDIIGDGPERQRVLYTIHDLGLQDAVTVRGKLAPEAVRDCLQKADVFVLSSLSEGISNAVLEAMSCGVPVVTTDCGGMREAVTDGVEGFVVPVRDPESMAEALGRLINDPGLRRRMGEAARQRILREFTLERQIDQWMELFESVLAEKAGRIAEAPA